MSLFQEISSPEKKMETDRPVMRETDHRHVSFSETSDLFDAAFKKFGLISDVSERKTADANDSFKNTDYSNYLEKGADGNYYDKDTGKSYDSEEMWAKAQETLAKRYESTATHYETKAKKEWAGFKNAETNGETEGEKWEHYRNSQTYYEKAEVNKTKAENTWAKLGMKSDVSDLGMYSGGRLLQEARISYDTLAEKCQDNDRLKTLCDDIAARSSCDDEVEPTGNLLPEYQRMMETKGYESEDEMCNQEGLNGEDIYDDESSTYGDEYRRGFADCIDEDRNPYTVDPDEYSEAYYQGLCDAQELRELIDL